MFFVISAIGIMSLIKVSIETPIPDSSKVMYCTADVKYNGVEQTVGKEKSCTRGSLQVDSRKPSLAERKSK
jgi:hypothetical protein